MDDSRVSPQLPAAVVLKLAIMIDLLGQRQNGDLCGLVAGHFDGREYAAPWKKERTVDRRNSEHIRAEPVWGIAD